jgi:hypothetical protein
MTDTPIIVPAGTTPGGLPYPEDSEPVQLGAQAIKALANAVDNQGLGNARSIYDAFQALAGNPVGPANPSWPIAETVSPENTNGDMSMPGQRMAGAAFMVRKTKQTGGLGYGISVASGGVISAGYIGAGLYYYDSAATWKFLANSGAGKPNNATSTTGYKKMAWRNAGDTADTPVTLNPGTVYLAGLVVATMASSQPNILAYTAVPGAAFAVNIDTAGGFQRSATVAGVSAKPVADILVAARAPLSAIAWLPIL